MITLVVDASAYVYATTSTEPAAQTVLKRIMDADCHAPHLLDAEVGNVLRRLELRGDIDPETALSSRKSLKHMVNIRYPALDPLGDAAWQLRGSLTYYDALYAALAKAIRAPLLTADARLSRAPGLTCEVEVIGQP
jgi:predicted nucleic acid-binding protein